jgi:hypothetical protein
VEGRERLVVVEGGISYELARDDRGPLGVATQAGKDFMHTAPFGCTAHLACLNVHMARVCMLQALVGSKLTVGHGDVAAHAWIGGYLHRRRLRCPHGCHSRANAHLGHAHAEMTSEQAPDQPLWWKWQKHVLNDD